MTERSRLIGLMARREASRIADARRSLAAALRQQQATETLLERLTSLLDARRTQAMQPMSVAELREHRRLTEQLAAEAERSTTRLTAQREDVRQAIEDLARKDHRKRIYEEAAQVARSAELAECEHRAEQAQVYPVRR
mgnify:CR=1 FL=1